ncbi:MAG: hypothetical protein JSW22_01550 [Chloroflexota bacterium]|nr:MAG: hypothetical protein JSW22_01550 [Chloroflexota bacterium]
MKRRILTFGVLLTLVTISVLPGVVSAADSTYVMGEVVEGYTFAAPGPIYLGSMTPSDTPYKGSSTDGSLVGNNANGYTVTGTDEKVTDTGYMTCAGGAPVLTNRHEISDEDANYVSADTSKTFVDTSGPTDVTFSLFASQLVTHTDAVGSDYSIEITFTVVANP